MRHVTVHRLNTVTVAVSPTAGLKGSAKVRVPFSKVIERLAGPLGHQPFRLTVAQHKASAQSQPNAFWILCDVLLQDSPQRLAS